MHGAGRSCRFDWGKNPCKQNKFVWTNGTLDVFARNKIAAKFVPPSQSFLLQALREGSDMPLISLNLGQCDGKWLLQPKSKLSKGCMNQRSAQMALGQKRMHKKNLLVKGKIDQNLWPLGLFFSTQSQMSRGV